MADVLGHGFVLLQLLEEDFFVKVEHVFHVGKEDVLFVDETWLGFKLAALVTQGVIIQFHTDLQVFHVCLFRLQQLRHDEPFIANTIPNQHFDKHRPLISNGPTAFNFNHSLTHQMYRNQKHVSLNRSLVENNNNNNKLTNQLNKKKTRRPINHRDYDLTCYGGWVIDDR